MRDGSRARRVLAAASAIGAAAALGGAATPAGDTGSVLEVQVHSLRSAKGLVHVCMTSAPANFPECTDDVRAHTMTVPAASALTLRFTGLEQGRYAIALLHDENGNGKVDKTLMIPKEGFGFSRDAKVRLGPPSFEAAAFEIDGRSGRQRIRMRYLL